MALVFVMLNVEFVFVKVTQLRLCCLPVSRPMKISLHLQEKLQIFCHGRKDSITYRFNFLPSVVAGPPQTDLSPLPLPLQPNLKGQRSHPLTAAHPGSVASYDPHSAPWAFVKSLFMLFILFISHHTILYHYASCPSPSKSRDFFLFFLEYNCFPMLW